jgi:LTXXQ motif family protein
MWTARVLIAAVLVVGVASSADARRRHHGYGGDGERSSGSNTLDQWRARQSQGQNSGQAGDDNRGNDRGQDRGQDRGNDRSQGRAQNLQNPQNLGEAPARDRALTRGDDRARYDRRRGRSVEDGRSFRETGDWRRYRGYRDERRRAREGDRRRDRDRDDVTPARAAAVPGDLALSRGRSGAFSATIDKLVRGCAAQAAEFTNWPLDDIARTVSADENQRKALETLRGKAKEAGERLAAECPRDVPAAPAARLEAAEQGIAATLAAFDTVEPALTAFYAALNDEQKARLYRDMAAPGAAAPSSASTSNAAETTGGREAQDARRERRDYSSRRHRWRDYAASREAPARESAPRQGARESAARQGAPGWSGTCEELAGVLRNWPVREIERDVGLTSAQRVAFYELVTSSLKAADTLVSACPSEAALTPVGRMQAMRQRLSAVRAATAAIRPALLHFYEALDQGQQLRFAGMS